MTCCPVCGSRHSLPIRASACIGLYKAAPYPGTYWMQSQWLLAMQLSVSSESKLNYLLLLQLPPQQCFIP